MSDAVKPGGLRELRKRRTRQAIFAAAYELFTSRGFEATSMEEIAGRAEVAPRTLYRYFPTKLDIITPGRTLLQRRLTAATRDHTAGDLRSALSAHVLAIAGWLDGLADEDAALVGLAARDAAIRTALISVLDDMAAGVADALVADPRLDVSPSDALLLASMAVAGMFVGHDRETPTSFTDAARSALRVLGTGIGGQGEAAASPQ